MRHATIPTRVYFHAAWARVFALLILITLPCITGGGCQAFGRKPPTVDQQIDAERGRIATEESGDSAISAVDGLEAMKRHPSFPPELLPALTTVQNHARDSAYYDEIANRSFRNLQNDVGGPPEERVELAPPPRSEEAPEVAAAREAQATQAQKAGKDAEDNELPPVPDQILSIGDFVSDWALALGTAVPLLGTVGYAWKRWRGFAGAIVSGVNAGRLPRAEVILNAMPPEERIRFGLDPSGDYMVVDKTVSSAAHKASGVDGFIEKSSPTTPEAIRERVQIAADLQRSQAEGTAG